MNYDQIMEEYYDKFDENFDYINKTFDSLDKAQDLSDAKKSKAKHVLEFIDDAVKNASKISYSKTKEYLFSKIESQVFSLINKYVNKNRLSKKEDKKYVEMKERINELDKSIAKLSWDYAKGNKIDETKLKKEKKEYDSLKKKYKNYKEKEANKIIDNKKEIADTVKKSLEKCDYIEEFIGSADYF